LKDFKFIAKKYSKRVFRSVFPYYHNVNGIKYPTVLGQPAIYDPQEEFLNSVILRYYGGIFVDVGANVGGWTMQASPYYHEVHAFEPNLKIFKALNKTVKMNHVNNVKTHAFALGSCEGFTMQRIDLPASSEIGLELGMAYTRTLDSFNLQNVSVIKIDVEGHAIDVLQGSRKTLESFPVVVVEAHTDLELSAPMHISELYTWQKHFREMPIDYPKYDAIKNRKQPFLVGIPNHLS